MCTTAAIGGLLERAAGSVGASGAANHAGVTLTLAEQMFVVKQNIERVFVPNA
jgi:hypothetical protein